MRQDNDAYTAEMRNYLQLPGVQDRRIFELAYSITSRERNRYDKARALERYLQDNFGYTLEQRAGGSEPLADFLFNIREGHCEYFATAMAVMLRTQGVATRIVNGFHGGEYNDASDMTVVRQRNAHSWVEVYFPRENVWVPFDPTPASGDNGAGSTGISAQISKYMEAIEAFWIQHFVAYDNQGQRSLLRSARNGIVDWQQDISEYFAHSKAVFQEWWADLRGSNGSAASLSAIASAAIYLVGAGSILALLGWLLRKIVKSKVWRRLRDRSYDAPKQSAIQFYERMQAILADKGFVRSEHQTPLEFAYATGIANAVAITQRYQKVRFGRYELSDGEAREVNDLIDQIAEV